MCFSSVSSSCAAGLCSPYHPEQHLTPSALLLHYSQHTTALKQDLSQETPPMVKMSVLPFCPHVRQGSEMGSTALCAYRRLSDKRTRASCDTFEIRSTSFKVSFQSLILVLLCGKIPKNILSVHKSSFQNTSINTQKFNANGYSLNP